MVRDEDQIEEVREKLTRKYKLKLQPPFRCDFRDPWGNRIQVVDLHDESLIWLLPYRELQKAGVSSNPPNESALVFVRKSNNDFLSIDRSNGYSASGNVVRGDIPCRATHKPTDAGIR